MISEPVPFRDMECLSEPFRQDAILFVEAIGGERGERLPFVVVETRRTLTRHAWLIRHGRAPNKNDPHLHGLAIDVALDTEHVYWKIWHQAPIRLDGTPSWNDTGFPVDRTSGQPTRPHVARAWRRLQQIASGIGLEFAWGSGFVPATVFWPAWSGVAARMSAADSWPGAGGGLHSQEGRAHDDGHGPPLPRNQR